MDMRMTGRRITRRSAMWFLLLCFFVALTGGVTGGTSRALIDKSEKTVRIGYFENEIFQEGASEGAIRKGYAYDYYRKLSEYTGWKYEYVYGSFSDLYQMLLDGKVDMLAGLAKTAERESIIGYPELAMGNETYNLVKHASDSSITTSYKTLEGKKIGVLDSAMVGVLQRFLDENGITAKVSKYPDYQSVYDEFDEKKVDVIVGESDGTQERPDAELLYAFGSSEYYLCVSIQRPDLLDELNQAQARLMTEEPNYINSLRIKYYSESISSRTLSATEKKWLEEHEVLRIGYLNHYLPYSDTGEDGEAMGLIRELVPAIENALEIGEKKTTYVGFDNYDDMIKAVQEGEVDAVFPVGGGIYFSEENGIYQSNAVVSSTTELIYEGEYSEDTIKSVAVNENNRMQYYYVKTNIPDAEIVLFHSIDECLSAVMDGDVGCTTLNGIRANDILKNRKYRDLSMKQFGNNDDRCFGVRIGEEGLLKLLNRGINLVGADQTQNMAFRYVDGLYDYSFFDLIYDNVWIVTLIAIVIAAIVIFFMARASIATRRRMTEKEEAGRILEEKNAELAAAVSAAESANRAKTYFLSTMSHDIRTPMNSILSMNEMVLRESENEDILMYSGHIRSSGNTLLGLINDILDFSKMEAGKLDIIPVDYEISSVLNDLVNMVQTRAEEKGLTLALHIDSGIPNYLHGDEIRIKQAVTNLLTNAVKYTREGMITFSVGYERVDGEEDAVLLNISVKDTGVGIRAEDVGKLFEAFERADDTFNRNIEGTGLGLTITHRLLNLMGSSLHVESELGKGTEFYFSVKQKVIKWDAVGDYETAFRRSVAERKRYREKFTAPDGYILVVDDTPANLVVIRSLLKRTKLKIDTANSADECIHLATKNTYDIIILDHMMPYKDGIEALRELRAIEDNPNKNTPMLVLTANAISGMRDTYIAAGFDDYLTKPIDPESLEEAIIRFLPDEKVFPAEDTEEEPDADIPAFLYEIDGLDVAAGVEHCGNAGAYLDAVRAYIETITMNIDEIERFREAGDIGNMTVRIHGMKSTARVIGALELSAFAESLEEAGHREDEAEIEANLDRFLEDYRTLGDRLMPITELSPEPSDEAREEISEEELVHIFELLKKHLDNADYDEIDTLGERLASVRVPEERSEQVERILSAISMLEYEEIEEVLK